MPLEPDRRSRHAMAKIPIDDESVSADAIVAELESVLTHELATPLAIIAAATSLALDQPIELPAGQRRELLEVIRRNSDLASRLLGRLNLARDIEAGQVELQIGELDLGALIREAVADLRHATLGDHPVDVTTSDGPMIAADASAVREILFNLLANAAKYSATGAPIVVMVTADSDTVETIVRNHGTGVTPGDTERIFEKFVRADDGTPGTGLGLFVARGLARAHGGELALQPATDVGSEFRLTLPVVSPVRT